jgi:pyruvate formate lyase activating enzyme
MCVSCGKCVETCPVKALSFDEQGKVVWDETKCVQCDSCIKVCPNCSSPKIRWLSVPEVMTQLKRSLPYIDGITTSGGECTQYNEFLIELFAEVKKLGKSCLIDSNGSFDFESDPRVLEVSDGVMLDVKAYEKKWNDYLISFDRSLILKNLEYLLKVNKLYEVRTLIFPDRDRENEETVRHVAEMIGDKCFYKIIRYRPFGVRENYLPVLGEFTTEEEYANRYVELARSLGAAKAYLV